MNQNIIAGLISGFLVTFLVVVLRAFWRDFATPWFENRVYKDIRIEGGWFTLYPTVDGERQEVASLSRHGHSVTGTIICNSGADKGERYKVSGSFRNLILTLTYETEDASKVDRGTITLKCVRNGERLTGKVASYSDSRDSIVAATIIWFRSQNDLDKVLQGVQNQDAAMAELRRRELSASKKVKEITSQALGEKPEVDTTSQAPESDASDENEE